MIDIQLTQIGLAFLEGVGLVLSPCILPVLPFILAGSVSGSKSRPIGIIVGFIATFTFFALLSRQILATLNVDPELIRNLALLLLAGFGILLLMPKLADRLLRPTQKFAEFSQNLTAKFDHYKGMEGIWGGIAIGALIGLIWTPCAGPVMAAALVQIIQSRSDFEAGLTVFSFASGAGIPMLIIAFSGQKIIGRLKLAQAHSYGMRRALGVIIIAVTIAIFYGLDSKLISVASSPAPEPVQSGEVYSADNKMAVNATSAELIDKIASPYVAPEIAPNLNWINAPAINLKDLRGKVVLIDFWTYSCINCVRTLPYLTEWDRKYKQAGLVIIGVHSPEFSFEKKLENVKDSVARFGIKYPVVLDNDFETWRAYNNKYWPAHYLIDQDGKVVYTHFGEGAYVTTEHNIQALLAKGNGGGTLPISARFQEGAALTTETPETQKPTGKDQTHETYLGYGRATNFYNSSALSKDAAHNYQLPSLLQLHQWALGGQWNIDRQKATSAATDSKLNLRFNAKKVFLVMASADGKTKTVTLRLNGNLVQIRSTPQIESLPIRTTTAPTQAAPVNGEADIRDGKLQVHEAKLYQLVDQENSTEGLLELTAAEPGLELYAFTFGG